MKRPKFKEYESDIVAFLKTVTERLENEFKVKNTNYGFDPSDDDFEDGDDCYCISNGALSECCLLELNVRRGEIHAYVYYDSERFEEIINEELPALEKKLGFNGTTRC